jgi:hypothetical protein
LPPLPLDEEELEPELLDELLELPLDSLGGGSIGGSGVVAFLAKFIGRSDLMYWLTRPSLSSLKIFSARLVSSVRVMSLRCRISALVGWNISIWSDPSDPVTRHVPVASI